MYYKPERTLQKKQKSFLVQVRLRQKHYDPKFDPSGVQAHDIQNMDSTFYVPEMLALTTEPS